MSVLKLVVTHETSLLVQKSCGLVTWHQPIELFFGLMRSLYSNLNALHSNLVCLSSNPKRSATLLARTPETVHQSYLCLFLLDGRITMIRPDVPNEPEQACRTEEGKA